MSGIEIEATDEARAYIEQIAGEMVALFNVTLSEAVGRINRFWLGKEFTSAVQVDVLLHEEPTTWAKTVYYGRDSQWWLGEDDLQPRPYP